MEVFGMSAPQAQYRHINFCFYRFLNCTPFCQVSQKSYSQPYRCNTHSHDHPHMWYCTDGEYIHFVGNQEYSCGTGSLIIVPPGTLHAYEIPAGQHATLLQADIAFDAYLSPDKRQYKKTVSHLFLPAFAPMLGFRFPDLYTLGPDSQEKAQGIFHALLTEHSQQQENALYYKYHLLEQLFSLPEFALTQIQALTAGEAIVSLLRPTIRALVFINQNYSKKITSETVSRQVSICRSNLFLLIKAFTGMTFTAYLQALRVARAKIALIYSDYSFSYIAHMCGFSDASYMSKCFLKYKGYTLKHDRSIRSHSESIYRVHIDHNYFEASDVPASE